ncbi:MAG: putative metal-dependent hydrolase [Saprospiraceae bacterium]|nr:putative metal-dependent hydrolase [Saprospiraceae bacterium]
MMENLKYPIGKFEYPKTYSDSDIERWIDEIDRIPDQFRTLVQSLSDEKLNTPYRPDGWTARQVIHHVPDSHFQAYCRFKWVLTEEHPTIKPYHENRWAELPDSKFTPVSVSLDMLSSVHSRWVMLMRNIDREDFDKYYIHPEYNNKYALGAVCKLYAWHGKHHLAHLQIIKDI